MALEILLSTGFPFEEDASLAPSYQLINDYLLRIPKDEWARSASAIANSTKARSLYLEASREILALPVAQQFGCIRASARFSYWSRFEWGWEPHKPEVQTHQALEAALDTLCGNILSFEREWTEGELIEMVALPTPHPFHRATFITSVVEKYLSCHAVTDALRPSIEQVREWNAWLFQLPQWLSLGTALGECLVLRRGERWADEALAFIEAQPQEAQHEWSAFLLHCIESDKAKPSVIWLKTAEQHTARIGRETLENSFCAWGMNYGQLPPSYELNGAVFKGLIWSASLSSNPHVVATVGFVAHNCVSSPRWAKAFSPSIFNACIWTLAKMSTEVAREHLFALKSRAQGSRLKIVDKALGATGKRGAMR